MRQFLLSLVTLLVGAAPIATQGPNDLGVVYRALKTQRALQIERLHAYAKERRFPKNTDFPKHRMPYFVDRYGTRCAVGELMWQSGRRDAVRNISTANNQVRVMDVTDGPLIDWVLGSGLTQEECAQVQPSYAFYFGLAEKERVRIQAHLQKVEAALRTRSEASLGKALRRYLDDAIETKALTTKHAKVLFKALTDKEPNVRIGAAHAIARLKIPANSELGARLKDENREVRFWAAAALLATLPPPTDPKPYRATLTVLSEILKNGTDDERLMALGRIGILACGARTLPGESKILLEIREALTITAKHKSKDVAFLTRLMTAVSGKHILRMEAAANHNVGRIFIELQAGNVVHAAALHVRPHQLQALIKKDPRCIEARNQFGETPLHLAAATPQWTQIALLLRHKPSHLAITHTGRTPLHGAQYILDGSARTQDKVYGWTPLHYAAQNGSPSFASDLLERGAPVNAVDTFGFTPLHIAVGCTTKGSEPVRFGGKRSVYVIDLLLKADADYSLKDKQGRTPLDWAKLLKNKQAIEALSKKVKKKGTNP